MISHDHHYGAEQKHVECHASPRQTPSNRADLVRRRLRLAIILTGVFMFVEGIGGMWSGSLALISDAGHMFSHLFALIVSYVAIRLAALPPDETRSFGFYRAELVAGLINGLSLLFVAAWIFEEAYHRLLWPELILPEGMLVIALMGLVINGVTALILRSTASDDINIRSAFLHMISDLLSSVGVVGAALIIRKTGYQRIDPIVGIAIALLIAIWSIGLLKEAIHILLQSTPKELSHTTIATALTENIAEIRSVHHIHIWELTRHMYVMTAHIKLDDQPLSQADAIRHRATRLLHERFHITHCDLQIECRC